MRLCWIDDSQSTLINFRLNFQDLEPHWSWVHYTDCLRLALLEKFGGIWADGTVCAMPELAQKASFLERAPFAFSCRIK